MPPPFTHWETEARYLPKVAELKQGGEPEAPHLGMLRVLHSLPGAEAWAQLSLNLGCTSAVCWDSCFTPRQSPEQEAEELKGALVAGYDSTDFRWENRGVKLGAGGHKGRGPKVLLPFSL